MRNDSSSGTADFEPEDIIARLLPPAMLAGTLTPAMGYLSLRMSGVADATARLALDMSLALSTAAWTAVIGLAVVCMTCRAARGLGGVAVRTDRSRR